LDTLKTPYIALIRSHLEYAVPVWDLHLCAKILTCWNQSRGSLATNICTKVIECSARVLFRIFWLGYKIRVEIDGGRGVCSRRLLFSRGGLGHAPPGKIFKVLSLLRVILRHFRSVLRS